MTAARHVVRNSLRIEQMPATECRGLDAFATFDEAVEFARVRIIERRAELARQAARLDAVEAMLEAEVEATRKKSAVIARAKRISNRRNML